MIFFKNALHTVHIAVKNNKIVFFYKYTSHCTYIVRIKIFTIITDYIILMYHYKFHYIPEEMFRTK